MTTNESRQRAERVWITLAEMLDKEKDETKFTDFVAAALAQARREGERAGYLRGLHEVCDIAVEECGNAFGFEERLHTKITRLLKEEP